MSVELPAYSETMSEYYPAKQIRNALASEGERPDDQILEDIKLALAFYEERMKES